ncbi:hypothetical protein D9M69_682070 [compost metagenome]
MSIAVPTAITSSMMAIISRMGLSMKGRSSSTSCRGMSATVISHALTIAAATRNMITAVVLAALTNTAVSWRQCSSR